MILFPHLELESGLPPAATNMPVGVTAVAPEVKLSPRALAIGELRKHVFASLEKTTLARCARVCTVWSDDALILLWHELDSVKPLLSTISPLVRKVRNTLREMPLTISDDANNAYRPSLLRSNSQTELVA